MSQTCTEQPLPSDARLPGPRRAPSADGILVVAPDDVTTEGVRALLEPTSALGVVGQARTLEQARGELTRLRPAVVVLDVTVAPGALDAALSWRGLAPRLGLVLLLPDPDAALLREARLLGGSGLVLRSSSAGTVRSAIGAVAGGLDFVDPALESVMDGLALEDVCQTARLVSPAERRVLERLTNGLSNRDISRELGISEHTVKSHLVSVTRKLGCRDRVHAAALAIQLGLV